MVIMKIILCSIIPVVYSLLEIQPVSIDVLKSQLPTIQENNLFITNLGKTCILLHLKKIQSEYFNALRLNGEEYKKILIKLLKCMNVSEIGNRGWDNNLISLYYGLNDYLNRDWSEITGKKFKFDLDEIVRMATSKWKYTIIEWWDANENRNNINTACHHLLSIFTDENEDNSMIVWLDNNRYKKRLERDNMSLTINRYRNTSNIVNYNDLISLLQNINNVPKEISLLITHYENVLNIYSEFIEIIESVNSIEDTGYGTQWKYIYNIYKEYLNIFSLAMLIEQNIMGYSVNEVLRYHQDKMLYFHIKFRSYFVQFISESDTTIESILREDYAPFYLQYLLIDIKESVSYIFKNYIDKENPSFNSIGQNCKSYNWPIINFNTFEDSEVKEITSYENASSSYIESAYTFQEKLNILKLRLLVSEYSVLNIINFLKITS